MATLPETGGAQPFESAPFRLDLATASMQKVRKIRAQRELLVTTLQDRKHLALHEIPGQSRHDAQCSQFGSGSVRC